MDMDDVSSLPSWFCFARVLRLFDSVVQLTVASHCRQAMIRRRRRCSFSNSTEAYLYSRVYTTQITEDNVWTATAPDLPRGHGYYRTRTECTSKSRSSGAQLLLIISNMTFWQHELRPTFANQHLLSTGTKSRTVLLPEQPRKSSPINGQA
jgi:hypothetical protein